MNEMKTEDVMRALELIVQRELMPNVDIDGTVAVENAERWFLHLLKEHLAPYVSALLREKDAEIEHHRKTIARNAQLALEVTVEEIQKARAEAIGKYIEKAKRRLPIISPTVFDQIAKEIYRSCTDESQCKEDA